MSDHLVAVRYAKALLQTSDGDLSISIKKREALIAISQLFAIKEARKILISPVMPKDLKASLLAYALEKTDQKDLIDNFLKVVLEANRVELIPHIISAFDDEIDKLTGTARTRLITALPIDEIELQKFKDSAEKSVIIETTVDSSILGGFVVYFGNFMGDYSLKTRIHQLTSPAAL
jgi:F-type H+-transporting ATPase subunit delta